MVGVSDRTGQVSRGSSGLAQGLVRVMDVLVDMPLASVPDLAGVRGISSSSVTRKLWELREMGLADSEILGWSRKRLRRWWLTPGGVGLMGPRWAAGMTSGDGAVSWSGFRRSSGSTGLPVS